MAGGRSDFLRASDWRAPADPLFFRFFFDPSASGWVISRSFESASFAGPPFATDRLPLAIRSGGLDGDRPTVRATAFFFTAFFPVVLAVLPLAFFEAEAVAGLATFLLLFPEDRGVFPESLAVVPRPFEVFFRFAFATPGIRQAEGRISVTY